MLCLDSKSRHHLLLFRGAINIYKQPTTAGLRPDNNKQETGMWNIDAETCCIYITDEIMKTRTLKENKTRREKNDYHLEKYIIVPKACLHTNTR